MSNDRYQSLRPDDRDEIDDLDAHIDDHIDLDEKDYLHTPRRSRRAKILEALNRYRWVIDGVLIGLIVMLLLDRHWDWRSNGEDEGLEGAGDVTGFAPQFSQKIVTFSPDPMFVPENTSEFWSDEVRQKWLGLVPKGLGYLNIEHPEKYRDLPATLVGYKGKYVVTTSMTHQLHCLYSIAEVFSAYTSGNQSRIPFETPWHLAHCFDYIRQGIMCAGDVALEGRQTTFPEGFDGSDGWDAKHVCKSYDEVLDYLNRNRADDEVWI
ncbi:uncharacterized protein JN550_000328 [Neoarthrinium moseri]|uniref:uncharacterized protein n=1 Tax=Neoarthrinium moseri TaxID=1658444 RepID=UPI001FDC16F9|nr:uncharacterized protein JN550_000328 [Neoarthrinium moseri]KAI1878146.1 hypothetical protein JN550_000328 [Neoarthrinium moseri]